MLLTLKKDGTLRLCIEYQPLNELTVRDSYHMHQMYECIYFLGDAKLVTTLDCNSGYCQVEVDEPDRDKTSFSSHHGM